MEQAPPKSPKPRFVDFEPSAPQPAPVLERQSFANLSPAEAYRRIENLLKAKQDYREITLRQKGVVLRKILADLRSKGIDLATVRPEDVAAYRQWLNGLVVRKTISEDYAAHVANQWNSMVRAVFGETSRAGEGLVMRGFRQRPKIVPHINEEEFLELLRAARQKPFKSEHFRRAFTTYLEVAWCTGARIGSLIDGNLRVRDIDWEHQTVRFRHMKNAPEHTAVLTARSAAALRQWVEQLRETAHWADGETPVFIGPNGAPLTPQWVNETLKLCAAAAGINKPLSTHKLRKAVGTIIGRENPKLGAQQLGITAKVFNEHYNLPMLEDRLKRRDLLPGNDWRPSNPAEIVGKAYIEYSQGRISKGDLDAALQTARNLEHTPNTFVPENPSYA